MLKIKLLKIGKKNESNFRIILTEAKIKPKPSRYLEILGDYNPSQKRLNLQKEKILYWISKGAQPSATLHNLFVKSGIIAGSKIRKGISSKIAQIAETKQESQAA